MENNNFNNPPPPLLSANLFKNIRGGNSLPNNNNPPSGGLDPNVIALVNAFVTLFLILQRCKVTILYLLDRELNCLKLI